LITTVFLNIHYNPNPFHFNVSQLSHLTFLHARWIFHEFYIFFSYFLYFKRNFPRNCSLTEVMKTPSFGCFVYTWSQLQTGDDPWSLASKHSIDRKWLLVFPVLKKQFNFFGFVFSLATFLILLMPILLTVFAQTILIIQPIVHSKTISRSSCPPFVQMHQFQNFTIPLLEMTLTESMLNICASTI